MQKYTILIEETVVEQFEVVAKTEKEAIEIARKKYKNEEFILESGEVQYAQMAVVQPFIEKNEWIEI
jgi:rRNA-processing protein FCF1